MSVSTNPVTPPMRYLHTTISWLFLVLFIGLLFSPIFGKYTGMERHIVVAEVKSEPLPPLTADPASWCRFFDGLRRQYLDRHYGFRDLLISWNNYLDMFVLPSAAPSSRVLVGEDKWLFLTTDSAGRNMLLDAKYPNPLSQTKLARLAAELERRRQWLAARGISYVVVLTPNKNTIYPEKLPPSLQPEDPGRNLRELTTYLQHHTKVDVVDVTSALLRYKKTGDVFFVSDSHWNPLGAFAGYQAIVKVLKRDFPAIDPLRRQQFRSEFYRGIPGDLAVMTGLTDHFKEDRLWFVNKEGYHARGASYSGPMEDWFLTMPQCSVSDNPALPRALVLHDSYWWEILPFIAESFSQALYVWALPPTQQHFRHFDKALVEQFKPNVVIEEFAERYIMLSARD